MTGRARCQSFSLIELLVVLAILGLALGVTGAVFAAGLRVWDTAQTFRRVEAEALLGLEIMERDVAGMLPTVAGGMYGDGEGMVFIVVEHDTTGRERLHVVRYSWSAEDGTVRRWMAPIPAQAGRDDRSETVVQGVADLRLDYYELPREQDTAGQWTGHWTNPTNIPGGVRVFLVLQENTRRISMTRSMAVPAARGGDVLQTK